MPTFLFWLLIVGFFLFCPDPLVHRVCHSLAPIDRALVMLYEAMLVAFGAWVLLQWKSILVSTILCQQRREQQGGTAGNDVSTVLLPLSR